MRKSAYTAALSGILAAMMLALGYAESLIPLNIGVPGIKLGLSNGVLIFAVYMLDAPTAYCLMALKVLLSGMLFGGMSSALYAFAGGLLSLTGMCLLSRLTRPALVSMAGGVLHNIGQVSLAMLVLRTEKLVWYMAALIPAGLVCGLLTGVCAEQVMRHLKTAGLAREPEHKKGRLAVIALAILLALGTAAGLLYANRGLFAPAAPEVTWDTPDALNGR